MEKEKPWKTPQLQGIHVRNPFFGAPKMCCWSQAWTMRIGEEWMDSCLILNLQEICVFSLDVLLWKMWIASFSLALLDLILESFHVTGRLAGTSDGRMLGAFGRAKRGVVFHMCFSPLSISHQPLLSLVTLKPGAFGLWDATARGLMQRRDRCLVTNCCQGDTCLVSRHRGW